MAEIIGIHERPTGRDGKSKVPLFLDEHTEEELAVYLDAVRDGIGLDMAARKIGLTATRMTWYANREPELANEIAQARLDGAAFYRDQLRASAHDRALEGNARILEVELSTHVPGYEHLRRDRIKHATQVNTLVLDMSKLDELPIERLREIEAVLEPVVIDQEPREPAQ